MTTDSDRIARLEGIAEESRERLNTIDARLTSIENRIEARFNLLIQLILGTWITSIIAIIAIGAAILLRQ